MAFHRDRNGQMQIVYHLGVHCTDEERLLKCLLRNRGALAAEGIAVPGPARYRNLMRDTAASLNGSAASEDTQALILDQILDSDHAFGRVVLSWDNFLAFPLWALQGRLYPNAGEKMLALARIFPDCEAEFHLAVRNPATFLPALLQKQRGKTYEEFMGGLEPMDVFWSDMIGEIAEANPEVPLHVWCDEDTPLVWPEVMEAVAGHGPAAVLEGADDFLASLMTADGFAAMTGYMRAHPPGTAAARREITAAFLEKYGVADRMQMTFDLPGWTEDLVERLTRQYDRDIDRIAALPGVTMTLP